VGVVGWGDLVVWVDVGIEREDEAEECVLRRRLFWQSGVVGMACVRSKCGRRQMMVNCFEA